MKFLKWLLIVVVVLVVAVIGIGFVLPDRTHVERSVFIDAKPTTVYTALNGFRQFNKWSPWADDDPQAQYLVEGPPMGVGAKQSWRSQDPSVGAGSQEIVETQAPQKIVMKLEFEGFDSENHATYALSPEGEGTKLVWSYDSTYHGNLLGRYFGLMTDSMLGPYYERGLADLKQLVESLPQTDFSGLQAEVRSVDSQPILYVSGAASGAEIPTVLGQAYASVASFMSANQIASVAPPIAITREYKEDTGYWRFDAGMIVDRSDVVPPPPSGVQAGQTYGGPVIVATYQGPYDAIGPTYEQLMAFKTVAGFEDNGDSWEQYLNDPADTPPQELITKIYWPVK